MRPIKHLFHQCLTVTNPAVTNPAVTHSAETRKASLALAFTLALSGCVVFPESAANPEPSLYWCPPLHSCVSTEAISFIHSIKPFELILPLNEAWPIIRQVVEDMQGTSIQAEHDGYIYAHSYTRFFHFLDFFEVLAVPTENRLNVRSSSLLALTDLFANYLRTERFREALEMKGVIKPRHPPAMTAPQ
jgi:uncharacterized protein (DUF1499 family)